MDEENQALTDKLKEAEEAPKVEKPAWEGQLLRVGAFRSAPVDNSIFLQMERP